MATYRPYVAPLFSLNSIPRHELCKDDVSGCCKDPKCTKDHTINLPEEDYFFVLRNPINTLAAVPRLPNPRDRPFDEAGRGAPLGVTVRHDNDCAQITDIQILPTVDEVSTNQPDTHMQ